MGCCGQTRSSLGASPTTPTHRSVANGNPPAGWSVGAWTGSPSRSVNLRYLEDAAIAVRGPVSGLQYQFSRSDPVQRVDTADAIVFLRTRFFRQA